METITYYVWTEGDPSTGGASMHATVTTQRPQDAAEDRCNREVLREAFGKLWDAASVTMMSHEEMNTPDAEVE